MGICPLDRLLSAAASICSRSLRATSHLSARLTAMCVTVNEVSSHLCKILTIIMVKTYLQTGRKRCRIARRLVVTCYNSAKPPETSSGGGGGGGGVTSTHNKRGCAILTRKVVPKIPRTYLKLRPKNPGTPNARLSF